MFVIGARARPSFEGGGDERTGKAKALVRMVLVPTNLGGEERDKIMGYKTKIEKRKPC